MKATASVKKAPESATRVRTTKKAETPDAVVERTADGYPHRPTAAEPKRRAWGFAEPANPEKAGKEGAPDFEKAAADSKPEGGAS